MESRHITIALVCAGFLAGTVSFAAGEKLQFSTPSDTSDVPEEQRELPRTSPNLFDRLRSGGPESLIMPGSAPQKPAQQRRTDDWRISPRDEQELNPEDVFGKKGIKSPNLADYVRAIERQETGTRAPNLEQFEVQQENNELLNSVRDPSRTLFSTPNFDFSPARLDTRNYTLNDYWKEATGLDMERFNQQATANRTEFRQILEPRTLLEQVGVTTPNQQQNAGLVAPAPTDFTSRTTQSSIAGSYQDGYMPMTGSRTTVFDDVNARSLGRELSTPLNTKIDPPRVEAQPAILPFPNRPGELFKRPGGL